MSDSQQEQTPETKLSVRELESYLAALESFIDDPIALINPDGIIADTNKEFATFLGMTQSQLVGQRFDDLLKSRELLSDLQSNTRSSSKTAVKTFDVDFDLQDGVLPANIRLQEWLNQDGDLHGYMIELSDSKQEDSVEPSKTNQKQQSSDTTQQVPKAPSVEDEGGDLLDEVKEQQMRAQSVLYNITDGIIFFNSDNTVKMVNPSAASMLHTNSSELIGKHIDQLRNNKVIDELRQMLSDNEELTKQELSIGAEAYFEVTTIIIGGDEKSAQQVVILHDISEKRKIEEMKLEFASVAAHQMRTPLSSIRWSFEILSKQLEDEDLLQAAERGYKSTEQVLEVVDELLNVDRLEEGDSGYEFNSLDIVELLNEIIKTESETGAVVDQPDINFEKPIDHVPNVRGDEMKLKIVFKNLLDNAVKYTDSDAEVTVRVNMKMTSGYGGDVVFVQVEDEGIGIPEESQDKIFSKFYRADNATDMETEGTGVGLFITKQIVEAHNGKIEFDSTPGEGTTFYVQLPMASDN